MVYARILNARAYHRECVPVEEGWVRTRQGWRRIAISWRGSRQYFPSWPNVTREGRGAEVKRSNERNNEEKRREEAGSPTEFPRFNADLSPPTFSFRPIKKDPWSEIWRERYVLRFLI